MKNITLVEADSKVQKALLMLGWKGGTGFEFSKYDEGVYDLYINLIKGKRPTKQTLTKIKKMCDWLDERVKKLRLKRTGQQELSIIAREMRETFLEAEAQP